MTIEALKLKFDNLLNEQSLGRFFSPDSVYLMLDSAKNETITKIMKAYYDTRRVTFINEHLNELIELDPLNTTTTGSGLQEYLVPPNFFYTLYAEYCNNGTHILKRATHLDFFTNITRQKNRYTGPQYDNAGLCTNPTYYIRNKKIGFFPQPAAGGGTNYKHYYLKIPFAINGTVPTNELQFRDNIYDIMIYYALYLACVKDNRPEEAKGYLAQFEKEITELTQ